jgi:hypothetical protein
MLTTWLQRWPLWLQFFWCHQIKLISTDRFLQQRSRQRVTSYTPTSMSCQWVIKQDSLKTDINVPLGKFLVIFHFCLHIYVCVMVCVCMCLCICKQLSTWSVSDVVLHFKIQLLAI